MNYNKTIWEDNKSEINAAKLNNIETGIEYAVNSVENINVQLDKRVKFKVVGEEDTEVPPIQGGNSYDDTELQEKINAINKQLETVRFKDKILLDKILNHFPIDNINRLQGYCVVKNNIIFSMINNDETMTYLYKYNLLDHSISEPKCYSNLKHSNDICYISEDDMLYVVLDGGNNVARLNATTLDYISNVTFPIGVGAIGFDNSLNIFVVRNYADEKFYIINKNLEIVSSFYHSIKLTEQGLCVQNGLIYMTYFEAGSNDYGQVEYNSVSKDCNYINVFDLRGDLVKTWSIGKFGEIEGIDFIGNDAILGINSCYESRIEFYKCQIKDNVIQEKLSALTVEEIGPILYSALPYNVYVNANNKEIGNGTENEPFSSIKEAIRYIYNCKNSTYFTLYLKGDFTKEKNIYIAGLNKKIFIDGKNQTVLDSIIFDNCSFVRMSNITLNNVSNDNNTIYLDCSTLDLRNCILNNSKNIPNANGIRSYNGKLILGANTNTIQNFNKGISMWQGDLLYSNNQNFANNNTNINLDYTICKCEQGLIGDIVKNNCDFLIGNNIVCGNVSMQCLSPNETITKNITIPNAKKILFASCNVATSAPQNVYACIKSIDNSTFTIAFNRTDTVSTGVTYMAIVQY